MQNVVLCHTPVPDLKRGRETEKMKYFSICRVGSFKRKKDKGPVKLMQWVKIAHSFLQSEEFHVVILSLPM